MVKKSLPTIRTRIKKILVTGSAKMDIYKKVDDSLVGRFFSYRLYPFDLKEIFHDSKNNLKPNPG
ncbi:MAG: AAA family ATPase [Leptospiraceae bacterium]|nr:AAA family ATPase [Leptospiraceae bacterium]